MIRLRYKWIYVYIVSIDLQGRYPLSVYLQNIIEMVTQKIAIPLQTNGDRLFS